MQEPLSQDNVEEAESYGESVDGKLRKYATKEVALSSSVPLKTIQHIWKRGKESETHDVSHRKTKLWA